jgi:hypothetical protein
MPRIDGYNAPTASTGGSGGFGSAVMGGGAASTGNWGGAVSPYSSSTIRSVSKKKVATGGRYSAPTSVPSGGQGPIQPVVPDVNSFLNQDSGYQQQLRDFTNALAQFNADVTRRKGVLESDYGTSKKAMEDQKVKDLLNLQDDYGARGVLTSGLYGKALGDYNTEFGNRMTDLDNKQTQALDSLGQESNRYKSQQDLQQQAAREDAIRRRAAQYGV